MQEFMFCKNNGLWYRREGDYYLPCLTVPAEKEQPIGVWGQRRRRYLREHKRALYTSLQLSGKLNDHLAETDRQAEAFFSQLVEQMAHQEGVTEQLKATDQMAWVGRMNNIRNRVIEIVKAEFIYIYSESPGYAMAPTESADT